MRVEREEGGVEGVCLAERGQEGLRSSGKLTLMHREDWVTDRCHSHQHGGNWACSLLFLNCKTWMFRLMNLKSANDELVGLDTDSEAT